MHLLPKPKKLEIKENVLTSKEINIKNLIDDARIDKALSVFKNGTDVILTVSASNEVSEGYKHGATGMINTNWGDYGHLCSIELSMHGFVLGAAKKLEYRNKGGWGV